MSSNNSTKNRLRFVIPAGIAGISGVFIFLFMIHRATIDQEFEDILLSQSSIFIALSSAIAFLLMLYLFYTTQQIKKAGEKIEKSKQLFTQKMHTIRQIIDILFRSNIWLPGLPKYIDDEFEGLTFFEVKDFYKGKSKLAIEFLQEKNQYQETENLYLELKALLLTQPNQKHLPENIQYPANYNEAIVEKWIHHKLGSGLWYFFGYKFGDFKEVLDLDAVYERHQEKMIQLAVALDEETFEDSSFNEIFLAKLGEFISKTVLPKLFLERELKTGLLPLKIKLFSAVLSILILLGILLPLIVILLQLPVILLMGSFSVVLALLFYIAISFYQFLIAEVKAV